MHYSNECMAEKQTMNFFDDFIKFQSLPSVADVRILTSGGLSIPAHSSILASVSPVLDKILDRPQKRRNSPEKLIPILGVPCNAVVAFVRFLYLSRCVDEDLARYGLHLLVLSHVYSVPHLKRACARALAGQLTAENVVDVLQLARQCDAPYLNVKCLKLLAEDFGTVEKTEGWKFLQDHDPLLELELLQFLDEAESRQRRRMRNRQDQSLYLQLSEAMECLQHICTEGCTNVGPSDKEPDTRKGPCKKFSTCSGLQLLIRHFATCKKRVRGRCSHCKRMWQLLRLHSSICDQPDPCKVPLCRQLKLRMQLEKKGEDGRWRLLVRKVVSAKAISTLSKRKRDEEPDKAWIMG
ncbi:BTB/POZ and TAZ domain-containing protein 1-like [Magnolia sinica]|uniref:BTB/POZ and TAZ domain-containing protein 1-like n=1 Tax=Magnolia sinica TaxID=86752 RepID=UPI00265ABB01|nr:BTB/POZ and TAZ domain-containing protein 1-like [Magnolia sinica]